MESNQPVTKVTLAEFNEAVNAVKKLSIAKTMDSLKDVAKGNEREEEVKKYAKTAKTKQKELTKIMDEKEDDQTKLKALEDFVLAQLKTTKKLVRGNLTQLTDYEKYVKDAETLKVEKVKIMGQLKTFENLSSHFQKEYEAIVEDHKKQSDAERAKRQEYAKELQKSFEETTQKLQTATEETSIKTREKEFYNEKMGEIQKALQERENIYNNQITNKESEIKSYQDKVTEKLEILEKEAKSKDEVKDELEKAEKQHAELTARLDVFYKKGEQFHGVVGKTNEMLTNLKKTMEKLGKQIKTLETENTNIQKKCEREDFAFISSYRDVMKVEKEIKSFKGQETSLGTLSTGLKDKIQAMNNELAEIKNSQPKAL